MAKIARKVDKKTLQNAINEVESKETFTTRSALHDAVAPIYNKNKKKEFPEITSSIVMLRITEFKLDVKTPKGKRGRQPGAKLPKGFGGGGAKNRTTRKEKFQNNPDIVAHFAKLRKVTPERFLKVLDRAEAGSMKSAVKLHCLQCVNFETKEVRNCQSMGSCPMWSYRPYSKQIEKEETSDTAEPEIDDDTDEAAA